MKLTDKQWEFIAPILPKEKTRKDKRGRPYRDPRDVLQGILWILKTGARWKDLPAEYPSYQTCHRRFQTWTKNGTIRKILERLIQHLQDVGKIDLAETFIDASYVDAKKGALKSVKPSVVRALKSWQSSTIQVFLSPLPLKVLHRMRVSLLKQRFGKDIAKTFLKDLSETKLTIAILLTSDFDDDIESHSLLPTSQIAGNHPLKMAELLEDTKEDGKWNDFLPGLNLTEE